MTARAIHIGDMVLVDKKGRHFHAEVISKDGREFGIRPINIRNTWRTCSAREIIKHWRARGTA